MARELILAKTAEEAVTAKTGSAVFVAGGTEVNRLGSEKAENADILISLKKCSGLSDITASVGYVTIGSMCTFQQLVESDAVPGYIREAALFMGSRTRRNMATIGGNIAALRDDSYLIPVLIAAGAVIEIAGHGGAGERMGIEEYIGRFDECKDSLMTSVTVPEEIKIVSKRYSNTAQSHAVLTMAASLTEDGFSLAAALKNSSIYRFIDFEKAIKADPGMSDDAIIEWFRSYDGVSVEKDMFGGTDYKRYLLGVTAADMYRHLTEGGRRDD